MTSQGRSTSAIGATAAPPAGKGRSNGAGAMLEPSQMMTDMAGALGSGLLRLTSRRLHAQAEHLEALAECRSVQQLMECQMEFLRRAGSDYSEQFGTLFQAAGAAGKDAKVAAAAMPAA